MSNQIKNPNGKLSDKIISERAPYWFVWDKDLKIVTELWTSKEPTIYYLLTFMTFAYSGLVHSWAPYIGASHKVLTERKIWLCVNDESEVDNLWKYVYNGYRPYGEMSYEQHPQKFQQVMYIKIIE
jgi:hypothetical protein